MPEPTPREDFERRCRTWAQRIIHLLDLHAPDAIIAHAICILWRCGMGHISEDMAREFSQMLTKDARQRCGLCQDCDNPIRAGLTHPHYCEACEAKFALEAFKDEVENGDYYEQHRDNPDNPPS